MEILLIWLISIVVSLVMDASTNFKRCKDIADNGYILDQKKYFEMLNDNKLSNEIKQGFIKKNVVNDLSLISIFFPFFINNIISIIKLIEYKEIQSYFIYCLNTLGVLIPMTLEEEEEYKKDPTGINAWYMFNKAQYEQEQAVIKKKSEELDELIGRNTQSSTGQFPQSGKKLTLGFKKNKKDN